MVKVPLSNSFLERRDARRKFSEPFGAGASLAPQTRQRISLGSENDWKFRLRSCQSWKAWSLSWGVVVPTQINKYRMRYVGLGRNNLRSHFVFRPRHAPEWLRARFLPVVFLANEEELTGKTFTTSFNTTNPNNTYVNFIFLRTSPLNTTTGSTAFLENRVWSSFTSAHSLDIAKKKKKRKRWWDQNITSEHNYEIEPALELTIVSKVISAPACVLNEHCCQKSMLFLRKFNSWCSLELVLALVESSDRPDGELVWLGILDSTLPQVRRAPHPPRSMDRGSSWCGSWHDRCHSCRRNMVTA